MRRLCCLMGALLLAGAGGCATQKESFTARTGVEQMLISSAVDKSLDNLDFSPLRSKTVFVETKYLDCVDKNYIILSLRQRALLNGAKLLDKADTADVVLEVASGGVGTDGQELFIGVPEIPLPPPSPIAIPRLSLLTRTKLNGTAKILVVAYDAKTRQPILPTGTTMARSDQNNWNVLGAGPVQTGSLPDEITRATGEKDLSVTSLYQMATGGTNTPAPRPMLATGGPPAPRPMLATGAAPAPRPMIAPSPVQQAGYERIAP